MTRQVMILKSAENDLVSLQQLLIKDSGTDAWQSAYTQIKADIHTLQKYPMLGFMLEETKRLNWVQFRQVVSGMNRIIYETPRDMVLIHAVCNVHQDMQSLIADRLLFALNE
jgi:toxin ParE1/3/4